MKKFGVVIAALSFTAFASGHALAQSAKFAASWDTDAVTTEAHASCDSDPGTATPDCPNSDGPNLVAETDMAQIHISTHKSVLIGVSSQIGIHLVTVAKGKGGSTVEDVTSTALASGGVTATVTLENQDPSGQDCQVAPGPIVLKSEMRALTVGATSTADEVEVMVGIDTNSESANHFNFLGVECDQGWYNAKVNFDLTALAQASGYDASADAYVTLGARMLTLQEVRAVKGSLVSDTD